jgi:uncharacterized protein YuzE
MLVEEYIVQIGSRTDGWPKSREGYGSIVVRFASITAPNVIPIEMELDFDDSGAVVGIEIINLLFTAREKSLELIKTLVPIQGNEFRYSYDSESDSFYLHLKPGRSCNQKSVGGSLFLDGDNRIICLSAEWL